MQALAWSLLIIAVGPPADSAGRHPDAAEVFHCDFEQAWDVDYNAWPDRWTRRRGPGFPRYLPIKIASGGAAQGESALKLELSGGGACAESPPIPVNHLFSYVLEGYLRTNKLTHSQAFCTVTFFDEQGKPLTTFHSPRVTADQSWQKFSVTPLIPPSEASTSAVIGLHLEPTGEKVPPDLTAVAEFDDLWLGRLPRMSLNVKGPLNVFTDARDVEVTCTVSGISERDPIIKFELVDVTSRRVDRLEHRLEGEVIAEKSLQASKLLGDAATRPADFVGTTSWKPQIPEPGYYRVQVTMHGSSGMILERQASLVLLRPETQPPKGEFGWSLPRGDRPLALAALGQLLPSMGINWIKFPVWVGDKEAGRLDQIASFAEKLSSRGIETVGVLNDPPTEIRSQFAAGAMLHAADIFTTKADIWYPSLEPVMTQLSLQIRWWQLGLDDDWSFVNYPNLVQTIAAVRQQIQRFGQEVHLGLGWRTMFAPPPDEAPPWEFLSLAADPALSAEELGRYLPALDPKKARRWLVLDPLPRSQYSTEVRASDLIHRMLGAKMHGAEAVFIPQPFDNERGLMNDDGTPGELLLPWRTTALALAGSQYAGSLQLPGGSSNHLFVRDGQAVLVVWNRNPIQERVFLGEGIKQVSVWGKAVDPPREGAAHVISVGSMPSFITGVQQPIARINMSVSLLRPRIPTAFGLPQENAVVMRNYFPQGVGGQMKLVAPDSWKVYPRAMEFKLAAGEEAQIPFSVTLPFDAESGRQAIRLDVELTADRAYAFSVHRELEVGLGDVTIQASTRLNDRGELEVEQQIANHTDNPVSFKCLLFIPYRQRMVSQVVKLRQDRDTKTYRLTNGRELVGKTLWLRAEEVGGQRILNHRFVAAE